jgi:hypothetical protein
MRLFRGGWLSRAFWVVFPLIVALVRSTLKAVLQGGCYAHGSRAKHDAGRESKAAIAASHPAACVRNGQLEGKTAVGGKQFEAADLEQPGVFT